MKFLAKMKEKQMQRKLGGILCGLLCTGVLVMPSAWADNYYGNDGKTHMSIGANVTLNSGTYDYVYGAIMIQRCLRRKSLRTMLLLPVLLQLVAYVVHILGMAMSERIL